MLQEDIYYDANLRRVTAQGQFRTPLSNPSAVRLSFPLYVGKSWSDSYEGTHLQSGRRYKYENSYKVVAYEYVTVGAGRFPAYRIQRENRIVASPAVSYEEYWYAPDIGVEVKRVPDWGPGGEVVEYRPAATRVAQAGPAGAEAPHQGSVAKSAEALKVIGDFADRLCQTIPLDSGSNRLELSGTAKAELDGVIKRLAQLGISGAGKYESSSSQNVLQRDLVGVLRESRNCRLQVWNDLKGRFEIGTK